MTRQQLLASVFTVALAACGTGEFTSQDDFEPAEELAQEITATTCPLRTNHEVCSGDADVWSAAYRVGRSADAVSEVAQTFAVLERGFPKNVRLKLRRLRPTPSPVPLVTVAIRDATDGLPTSSSADLARATIALDAIDPGLPKEHVLTFASTTPAAPVPLATGRVYALVFTIDEAITTASAYVGVASHKTSAYGSGHAWWRGARLIDGSAGDKAFAPAGSDDLSFSLELQPALGAAQHTPALSCKAINDAGASRGSDVYWLDPNGGATTDAFRAYCDMATGGGGWTMCYSDNSVVHMSTEIAFSGTYGSDNYRSDCRNIPFKEVLYVNHASNQQAWFARDAGVNTTMASVGYGAAGNVLGLWSRAGGVATSAYKYQLLVCDSAWMWTGLFMSGFTKHDGVNCWKRCNSWCGDETSAYFRPDGDNAGDYNGVAFNENGHRNVTDKLMSVGVR